VVSRRARAPRSVANRRVRRGALQRAELGRGAGLRPEHRAPLAALKQAGKKYHEYPIQLQAFYFMAEAGVP
jgi:hypothetical protein